MQTFRSLSDATAKTGEIVRVKNNVIDATYRRLDQRSALSKRRAEFGQDPKWFQEKATVSPSGHLA
jgi:hypothetical protein